MNLINHLALAADHAGFEMKEKLKTYLEGKGIKVLDLGTYGSESVDYPDFGHRLANAVLKKEKGVEAGISLCGSGNGINMAANKHKGIRSALCWNPVISRLARAHNDANVCAIPARFVSESEAIEIADAFLRTEFDGGRHVNRVNKI